MILRRSFILFSSRLTSASLTTELAGLTVVVEIGRMSCLATFHQGVKVMGRVEFSCREEWEQVRQRPLAGSS